MFENVYFVKSQWQVMINLQGMSTDIKSSNKSRNPSGRGRKRSHSSTPTNFPTTHKKIKSQCSPYTLWSEEAQDIYTPTTLYYNLSNHFSKMQIAKRRLR